MDRRSFLTATFAGIGGIAASSIGLSATAPSAQADEWREAIASGESGHVDAVWSFMTPPPVPTEDQVEEVVDCDIVVMGAGVCGLPAAMRAADLGANVHVIEKSTTYGNKRFGSCAFNAQFQKDAGIMFDRESYMRDAWAVSGGFQARLDMYGMFFDYSGPVFDWLKPRLETQGVTLAAVPQSTVTEEIDGVVWNTGVLPDQFWTGYAGYLDYAYTDPEATGYPEWTKAMADYAEEAGAVFHYNMPGKQLITDDDGNVVGIYAYNNYTGKYVRFNASKGVLLASGGIEGDKEMVQRYCPIVLERTCDWSMIELKNTGDAQKMALWIGADHDDVCLWGAFPYCTDIEANKIRPDGMMGGQLYWSPAVGSLPCLQTNVGGSRIQNEALAFVFPTGGALSSPQGKLWSFWDGQWEQKILPYAPENPRMAYLFCVNTQEQIDREIELGLIKKADTIEELAQICDINPDTLQETIQRYNKLCEDGYDKDFLKEAKWMTTVDTPPFYAACTISSLTGVLGGLKYDTHMRVIDKKGDPINGLYCAGTVSGNFYGMVYPSNVGGSCMGHGTTFAYLAIDEMLNIDPAEDLLG